MSGELQPLDTERYVEKLSRIVFLECCGALLVLTAKKRYLMRMQRANRQCRTVLRKWNLCQKIENISSFVNL